jgi:beta-barrel assembly-enhancing protease
MISKGYGQTLPGFHRKPKALRPGPLICKFALFLFLAASITCCKLPSARALSIEDEKELGREFLARISRSYPIMENDTALQYLQDLGEYLGTAVDNEPFDLNFYILKNSELNAFAAPGGHIFLHTGLIVSLETADELAAVLTHEIAHVTARHLSQRIAQQQKLTLATAAGMLAGALIGGEAAEAIISGSVAASAQAQLRYSRNDERQADQMGFDYMEGAGFMPEAMLDVLDKIEQSQWRGGSNRVPTYLLTHPGGPERMSSLDLLISHRSEVKSSSKAEEFRKLFPFFQTAVTAASMPPSAAERTFRDRLSRAEGRRQECLAHLGLGMALSSRAKYDEAAFHLESALSLDPQMPLALLALGDTYRMAGRMERAVSILDRALEMNENNQAALYLTGLSYLQMEDYKEAVRYLERLASTHPQKNDVFYQLGIAYGRLKQLARAHYNFGKYFSALFKYPEAVFHFEKAEKLARGNPMLLDRIRREMQRQGIPSGDAG